MNFPFSVLSEMNRYESIYSITSTQSHVCPTVSRVPIHRLMHPHPLPLVGIPVLIVEAVPKTKVCILSMCPECVNLSSCVVLSAKTELVPAHTHS